ncbi:MAG TPA: hypothetical protein VF021_00370 [Longimicrobiales bacterium]
MSRERSVSAGYGAVAVALTAVVLYALALGNGFALDDVAIIPGDPRVTGMRIGALLTQPYWSEAALGLYRPIASLTYALDWSVSNGSAAWFHFTNLLWHALASVLAYALLRKFFRPVPALIGGLIFAAHPVHTEAVANVVGRNELIAAVFFLAACLVWIMESLQPLTRVLLTAACYALAMLAKESAVMLPAVLVLIDAARAGSHPQERHRWRDYAVLGIVLAGFMLLRWSVLGGLGPARVDPALELTRTAGQRILTALQAWPTYARLLFFPRVLLADYGPRILLPIESWTPAATLGLTLLIATVTGGVVALRRGEHVWALGLLWFPVTILPVSNFLMPIGVMVAERTLYLPSLAVCIAAAGLLSHPRALTISGARVLLAVVLLALAVRTVTRVPAWKSTDSIMMALARERPDAFRGQWHAARMARARQDVNGALAGYDRALSLWPFREGLVREAAAYASSQGREAWATNLASYGAQRWPNNVDFHRLLAAYALDHGDTTRARALLARARRLHPADSILNQMWRAITPGHQ